MKFLKSRAEDLYEAASLRYPGTRVLVLPPGYPGNPPRTETFVCTGGANLAVYQSVLETPGKHWNSYKFESNHTRVLFIGVRETIRVCGKSTKRASFVIVFCAEKKQNTRTTSPTQRCPRFKMLKREHHDSTTGL
eukprot:3334988-Rhodomonas_salina.4